MTFRYIVEIDLDDVDDRHEVSTLKFLGSALHLAFGDTFKLFTEDGKQIEYDALADDHGNHEGHEVPIKVKD